MTASDLRRRELRRALLTFLREEDREKKRAAIERAHEVQVWEAAAADWKRKAGVKIRGARRRA